MAKKEQSPIERLKEILANVEARRQSEVQSQIQQANEEQAQAADAELMPDYKGYDVYVSFDGDNIGNAVARAEETDDEAALMDVSQKINAGQDVFTNYIVSHGGRIIQQGGDEGLGLVNSNALLQIEDFREEYLRIVGATVTVGVGQKISEATQARMLGKLRGKDQVCYWTEQTETEIELRQEQDDDESKKLQEAGLIGQSQKQQQNVTEDPEGSQKNPKENQQDDSEQDELDELESPDTPQEQNEASDEGWGEQPSPEEHINEEGQQAEGKPNEEDYDYTDMDVSRGSRFHHHQVAHETSRNHGGDKRFLESASRRLLR